ncbi:menaquinone biosynthesis family protein [Chlamydia sp.]|uniref:menaquinone biosynthesis family protein n=1 Tax=Chlamydia sp. TaxID=35827 RepID=UPI0025B80404|nr:menaquinone biosynthesis family protein [Chlamydia sp.]MBQ8498337.1 menaquinone biosynthesis family protein [Chlamydia sp.]
MTFSAAFSPCPNDIFLFRSFLEKHKGFPVFHQIMISDIASLNHYALEANFSLVKISASLYPLIADSYDILNVGTTLGYEMGPLVLSKQLDKPLHNLATPGTTTTAHALCRLFYPEAKLIPMKYHKIIPAILANQVDGGVVIHEERFSFPKELRIVGDLGHLWTEKWHLPLPLGCIAISKNIPSDDVYSLNYALQRSLRRSLTESSLATQKASEYSRDKSLQTIQHFINTYVTEETFNLSPKGKQALSMLWTACRDA